MLHCGLGRMLRLIHGLAREWGFDGGQGDTAGARGRQVVSVWGSSMTGLSLGREAWVPSRGRAASVAVVFMPPAVTDG